jgi:hypothetical protein
VKYQLCGAVFFLAMSGIVQGQTPAKTIDSYVRTAKAAAGTEWAGTFLRLCIPPPAAAAGRGYKERFVGKIKVHGKSLEGNLEGDSPDRDVFALPAAELCHQPEPGVPSRVFYPWLCSACRDLLEIVIRPSRC